MKLETVKSIILTTLVGVSLLLTLGLWNYKPNYAIYNNQDEVDMDIGGTEVAEAEIIEPESIIFHQNNKHFGFIDPTQQQQLYQDMQSWVLYNMETKEANGAPNNDYQVEIIFPDALPMGIVKGMLNEETFLPDWSFKRMFITFNQDSNSLNIRFLSANEKKQAIAIVNNPKKYDLLWGYVTKHKDLREYIVVDESDIPIYIPKNSTELTQRSFSVTTIDTDNLVDSLFDKPSIVSRSNIGEPYFSDSKNGMRIKQDGKLMEFLSPIRSTSYQRIGPLELLNRSITNINEHKGWTGVYNPEEGWKSEYNLVEMNIATNLLRYRMFYNGYPVYNNSDLTKIEQVWHNLDLNQYKRPIFSLNSSLGGESIELQSGQGVISYLQNNPNYNLEEINDIKIGYHLTIQKGTSTRFYVRLEPAWYLNENGTWKEIDFGDEIPLNKGGS